MLGDILDDKPAKSKAPKEAKKEIDAPEDSKSSDDFEKEFMSVLNDINSI